MGKQRFVAVALAVIVGGLAVADEIVTFDEGTQGWIGPQGGGGVTFIDASGGNPGANLHTIFQNFGITFRNNTSSEFIGDYSRFDSVTLEIDVKVESIAFFGSPVSRPWLVELRDYDDPPGGYPYVSVWYKFADIAETTHGNWTMFSVTIDDTAAVELPAGWGGTGAEDPDTFEPILPPDRTFADVIDGIDEIAYTTYEPGFGFGETAFDIRLDNIAIFNSGAAVPGEVPELLLARSDAVAGDLVLSWQASCGASAQNYGIYEGQIADWYTHSRIDCSDDAADLTEEITPAEGDRYYLVVPLDPGEEGSYGSSSAGAERPPGISRCRLAQDTTACL